MYSFEILIYNDIREEWEDYARFANREDALEHKEALEEDGNEVAMFTYKDGTIQGAPL